MLSRTQFKIKPYELKLSLHSLNEKHIEMVLPLINQAADELNLKLKIVRDVFKRSSLKNYAPNEENSDASILIHMNSGRLLLTDKNGIYEEMIKKLFIKTSRLGDNKFKGGIC